MKKLILTLLISTGVFCFAQERIQHSPPKGNALVGETYGAGVSKAKVKKAVSPEQLDKELKTVKKLEDVAVKGKVIDVCPKKGCWLTIETEDHDQFFVRMKDYSFFVPTALKGKTVVLEGTAEQKIVSVIEQKHYAEDAKKPQAEIDAITQPQEEIRFLANGIKVVK